MVDLKSSMADRFLAAFEKAAQDIPAVVLGAVLKEYVAENNHDGWEGFTDQERLTIAVFLDDVMKYYRNLPQGGQP